MIKVLPLAGKKNWHTSRAYVVANGTFDYFLDYPSLIALTAHGIIFDEKRRSVFLHREKN